MRRIVWLLVLVAAGCDGRNIVGAGVDNVRWREIVDDGSDLFYERRFGDLEIVALRFNATWFEELNGVQWATRRVLVGVHVPFGNSQFRIGVAFGWLWVDQIGDDVAHYVGTLQEVTGSYVPDDAKLMVYYGSRIQKLRKYGDTVSTVAGVGWVF